MSESAFKKIPRGIWALGLFVVSVMATGRLGSEFFPNADSGDIEVTLELPADTRLEETTRVAAPEQGVNKEYGKYMVDTNDCRVCHGPNLNGGPFPDPTIQKISPNLTPGGELAAWTEEQFIATLRTGVTPSGHQLDPKFMPWDFYQKFTDDELKAIWLYLQSVPAEKQYTK